MENFLEWNNVEEVIMKRKKALVLASLIAVSIISNLRICYAECIYSRGDVIRFTDNYDSIEDASDSVDIQGLFSKKKTVKKNYKNFNSIPSSIYYEEYIDNLGNCETPE